MKNRLPSPTAETGEDAQRSVPEANAPKKRAARRSAAPASRPRASGAAAGPDKTASAEGRKFKNDVRELGQELQDLVSKMLIEGSTFEDVVEAVSERGDGITLNAVQNHFRGDQEIQKQRVRRLMDNAAALLSSVDTDPESAEAQLARATFLTGYSRVHRDAAAITPKDAERFRLERENLRLKHQVLVLQKKKAAQDLDYSRARTRLITLTQGKLREEILKLQREVKERQPGDPMGPEMLKRIQQLYGLACQPLVYEEAANGAAKA